jgi:hypothetical protein
MEKVILISLKVINLLLFSIGMYYYWFGGNSFKLGSVFCFLSILTSCLDVKLMKDTY